MTKIGLLQRNEKDCDIFGSDTLKPENLKIQHISKFNKTIGRAGKSMLPCIQDLNITTKVAGQP